MPPVPDHIKASHAAANLRLFVETCAQGSTDLIKQMDEDGVVGKDPERSWSSLVQLQMSTELPKGRHYYFDASACGAIAGYYNSLAPDQWFELSRRDSHWSQMPGASFLSFAVLTLGANERNSGPLLGAALLPAGAVGFLTAVGETENPEPLVKIARWRDGTSWKQFIRDMGPDRDDEMAQWASVLLAAMELGPKFDHEELMRPAHDHNRFILHPEGGFIKCSATPSQTGLAWDGQWKGRLN